MNGRQIRIVNGRLIWGLNGKLIGTEWQNSRY